MSQEGVGEGGFIGGSVFYPNTLAWKTGGLEGGWVGRKEKAMHERGVLVAPRARGNR